MKPRCDLTKWSPALLRYYVTPFKGRRVALSKPVDVYRNLRGHAGLFSLRQRGLVVGHADALMLGDATFHVGQVAWKRALREGKKNVHAVARGRLMPSGMGTLPEEAGIRTLLPRLRYELKAGAFMFEQHKVTGAMCVALNGAGMFGAYFTYGKES